MDGLPTPRRYLAILAISCGTALAVIDGSVVTVALPTLAHDLGVHPSAAVSVVTVYQLVLVMTLLPFSALGSRIGLRRLYQYGQIAFLVATVLCFFARSLAFLLLVRGIQALGAAASLSVSSALIRSTYPARQLGRGLGIGNVVVSSSIAIAPTLGGLVLSVASWPWIFAAAAPLALLSLLLGARALPEPQPRDDPYDVRAALLCALTFGLIISGLESAVHGGSPLIAAAMVGCGALIAVVFVRRELTSKIPILPVDLLMRPVVGLSALGGLLVFIASMTVMLSLPFRLQQHYGFLPGEVGAMLTPWPLAILLIGPTAGMLSDRFPAGILGGIGMTIATIGLLTLAFLPAHVSHFDLVWRMALSGAGFGLFVAPNARLIIHAAPHERAASAGGLISTTRLTGQTLGATLLAALLSVGVGTGPVPALLAAGLALLAGICSVARLSSKLSESSRREAGRA
ncbi:MAG TPA: MFS transporter [Steroidobacteraceae bacterium]|jgi:DHA2 family multidrug resistance protein-like MFS transporter|nr:MFS transporter [Steroidobacteraceae bacterium]